MIGGGKETGRARRQAARFSLFHPEFLTGSDVVALHIVQLAELGHRCAITLGDFAERVALADAH